MFKIVYIVSTLRRCGPIQQLFNLIKYLDRKKFHPRIVTLSPEPPESLVGAFKKIAVECTSLGLSRMAGMILGPRRIEKLLDDNPADLIHVSDYRSLLLCANHLVGIPRVVSCRQAFHHTHYMLSGDIGPILSRVMVKTFAMACKKCEGVVAVSDFVRCSARNGLAAQMTVIKNGVDQDIFRATDEKMKADLRSKLNLPRDKHVFLSVGFLSKRKNPITVIEGFLQSGVSQTAVLVFLGDGPLHEECLSVARRNNSIHIVGFVENVRDYLYASDVFISASLTEGCPNAILEAMACGLPCILSDIRAHKEIAQHSPVSTKLFPAMDAQSLANKIREILDQDYAEMSLAAVQAVTQNFSARMMSENYQRLYASILNPKETVGESRCLE